MSDHTSAGMFARIFDLLAKNPTEEHKAIARELWAYSGEYDFRPYQMDADNAGLLLGIARRGINPRYPEDGEMVIWDGEDGFEDARDCSV